MDSIGALLTGLATTGNRVYRGRVFAIEGTNGISYSMGSDTPVGEDTYIYMDSDLEVIITAHSKDIDVEQELNQIRKEVTIALKADYSLGGLAIDITEEGWNAPDFSGDADQDTGLMQGTFIIKYRRLRTDPSSV